MSAALALSLLGAGCAGEVGREPLADEDITLPEGARVLATVRLSETHAVKFYDLGNGHSLVAETTSLDFGEVPVLTTSLMDGARLPQVYRTLAGEAADPQAIAALEAFEASRPAEPLDDSEPEVTVVESPARGASADELIDKDAFSDARWFSQTYCNKCMGWLGTKMSWMPQDAPVCMSAPEACVTNTVPWQGELRSRNLRIAAFNQSNTTGSVRMWLKDPCENDSWWSRLTSACTKGSSLVNVTTQPRTAYGFVSTSSATWTRVARWDASTNGIMWDVY